MDRPPASCVQGLLATLAYSRAFPQTLSAVAANTAAPTFTVHAKGRISTADTSVLYDEWTINEAKVLRNTTIGY